MRLTSIVFEEGRSIPARYTCDGENESPPLAWSGVPKAAKSLVLLCNDPDAPLGTWHHWAAYDIEPGITSLPGGMSPLDERCKQAVNDFRQIGYGGPCPPAGPAHRYYFRLLALSVAELPIRAKPTCKQVEAEARQHMIAEARLCGTYGR